MSNLSDLPPDLLVVIAKRLKKFEDFVCFRCVSKSLFAAAKDEYFEGLRLRQQMPYLMLPVMDDGNDDVRELYSLVEGESIVASIKAPNLKTKKCFESLGWLLAVGEDGNMSLFDPFSDIVEIPLPHQNTLSEDVGRMNALVFIQKMVLSSRPSETSDFVLMVICGGLGHLAYWRLGDNTWNKIEKRKWQFRDVVYHGKGKFYAISIPGDVWVFNLAGNDNQARGGMIIRCESILPDYSSMDPRLVYESTNLYAYGSYNLYLLKTVDGALLLITRIFPDLSEDRSSYITTEFHVYELDIALKSWKEIYSLGSMAVFLGHNSTIAVDASRFSGGVIKPNHIYFTEDEHEYYFFHSPKGGGTDMGVYNLETRTVEPIYPGKPLCSKVSTTIWINPCI